MDSPADNTREVLTPRNGGSPVDVMRRGTSTMGRSSLRLGLLAIVIQPALIGAFIMGCLNWATLATAFRNDQYEGADATSVRRFLSNEYHSEVVRAVGLTFALSLVLGLCLGTGVSAVIRARRRWLARTPLEGASLLAQTAVGVCSVQALVWMDDIVMRPALYQDVLLNAGGWVGSFQILLTDHVHRVALWLLALALLLVWLLLPALWENKQNLRWRSLALPVGLVTVIALIGVWPRQSLRTGDSQTKRSHAPNVLVIAADSLRPDRITPSIAPHIAALKTRSVDFSQAYTPLARTFPAWVSILTGNYPHHHGIRNMFPRWETRTKDFRSIPASFASTGYRTSVVSDFAGDIFRRVDLGFQHLDTPTLNMRELLLERLLQKDTSLLPWLRGSLAKLAVPVIREMHVASDAEDLTANALAAIDASGDKPFFLTVFYSTTHFPYAAPDPFYRKFTNPKYKGSFRYAKADTLSGDDKLSTDDVLQTRRLFDGAVAAVDAAVGELIAGVTSRGLMGNTIVVITADHGETLYEYGRGQGHGDHLQGDENLHVPLIVFAPGAPRASVPANVSLVDLGPTLCELAHVSCSTQMDGRSLAPAVLGKPLSSRPVFAETGLWFTENIPEVPLQRRIPYPDLTHLTEVDRSHVDEIVIRREWDLYTTAVKHRMIREGNYKLVYMPTRQGPKFALFDTATDPGEVTDVATKFPEVTESLRATLMQWIMIDTSLDNNGGMLIPRVQREGSGNGT